MSKKIIKTSLKTKEEVINLEVNAIITDNKITYIDNGITNIVTINKDNVTLNRSNNEYELSIKFSENNSICTYKLKDIKKELNLDVKVISLNIKDNYLYIKYSINDDINEYEINY